MQDGGWSDFVEPCRNVGCRHYEHCEHRWEEVLMGGLYNEISVVICGACNAEQVTL
jgi:hypothetical protein